MELGLGASMDFFTMRKVMLHLLMVLFLTALGVHGPVEAAQETESPRLLVTSLEYDAGRVDEGETISHAFEVKNAGDEELRILSVKPG